jgi:peptidoglycan-associated lipoprotein
MALRLSGLNTAVAISATMALLAGCETTKLPEQRVAAPVETRAAVASAGANAAKPATASGTAQSGVATVDLANRSLGGAGGTSAGGTALVALPSQRVVYFDFDSFAIKSDYKSMLDGYARVLQTNKGKRLVIEGHTDERGGREYNLALGQKRAAAVVGSLKLLGATDGQLEAVSFGEERPAASGSEESAWAKNRRAELKDR